MNNFGVIELATTKTTTAPGWAYVPDQPAHQRHAQQQAATTNRKRARTAAAGTAGATAASQADVSARQEAKARREIESLDRDNARDVQIAIPAKRGGGGATAASKAAAVKKYTPNVRRILQSQKTFANHLDDYVALLSQQQPEANPNTTEATRNQSKQPSKTTIPKQEPEDTDMPYADADADADAVGGSTLEAETRDERQSAIPNKINEDDNNPLLVSRLPPLPSADVMRALLSAPPLSYLEAQGTWPPGGQTYPVRSFCAVCGYWGRVRCMKCGTRVCALDCLDIHREECITRYGL
ncbi:hypothetical protein GGR50DRAFT_649099 [Xylaria sp. CBS 124048]|nr:hypothetical protein GGR50DRAFT_649099 [Xylaria sp. CBS 124048]